MFKNVNIILLAAGASARLGKPKQLLVFKGKSLLEISLSAAIGTGARNIILVLGANADVIKSVSITGGVTVVNNHNWQEGIASSIRLGLEKLLTTDPTAPAVLFMLCDQPFINSEILLEIWDQYQQTGKPIIASRYGETLGIPALFDAALFSSLLSLQGEGGAKKIIMEHSEDVSAIDFSKGNIDIDTVGDYEKLLLVENR